MNLVQFGVFEFVYFSQKMQLFLQPAAIYKILKP